MSDLHIQLKSAQAELKHLERVRQHYADLAERLRNEKTNLVAMEAKLDKEQRDVEKLENSSLQSLFRRLLGDREKQLEKERQEYLHAALLYNDARKSVELIEYEMNLLEPKLHLYDKAKDSFSVLKSRREQELLSESSSRGMRLREIYQEVDRCNALLTEIDEATRAGNTVMTMLHRLEDQLKKARNWGQWDMFTDGGGWVKHSAIDRAREMLHRVRHELLKFEKEVLDVYKKPLFDVDLRIERIDNFVDIFFDNLITDWVVQKKIKTALDNTRNTIYQVESALKRLSDDALQLSRELGELEDERDRLVTDH